MSIISTQMSSSIKNGSWIRRMFEAGIQLKQKYGDDAVCDFSLGNPDLAPPPAVGKALAEFVKHVDEPFSLGYMPNNGSAGPAKSSPPTFPRNRESISRPTTSS